MNKTLKKERLWIIGCLLIFIGAFLAVLFMLCNENFFFLSLLFPYSLGFFITGLITLIFGFMLTTIYGYNNEESDLKLDNRNKTRAVLITVIIVYLILLGYLMNVNTEWNIRALIIQIFYQSYAFYPEFVVSSYQIFFLTLLLFGIFILPTIIVETGFLDDSSNKEINELNKKIYQKKDLNLTLNRFSSVIRNVMGSIKKYEFSIGFVFTVFGSCLIILPYFLLKDILRNPGTHLEYYEPYYGFIRGQLLAIGLIFLAIGLIIILVYDRHRYLINQEIMDQSFLD